MSDVLTFRVTGKHPNCSKYDCSDAIATVHADGGNGKRHYVVMAGYGCSRTYDATPEQAIRYLLAEHAVTVTKIEAVEPVKAGALLVKTFTLHTGRTVEYEFGFNGSNHYLLRDGADYAGLWFEGKTLVDYDGVFELNANAKAIILEAGFKLDDEAA